MAQFDEKLFQAALSYYGLPANYDRNLTQARNPDGSLKILSNTGQNFLIACEPRRNSLKGYATWTQVNPAIEGEALTSWGAPKKPFNDDIGTFQNLTLDFEYPPDPERSLLIAFELVDHIVREGLAESGLAIENSGAGPHIALPLIPLDVLSLGGGELVNSAVRLVVTRYIKPEYDRLVAEAGLKEMDLTGFDLSRVLSLPGTWRPTNPKKADCDALKSGVLRRFAYPLDEYPVRQESSNLAELVKEAVKEVEAKRTTSYPQATIINGSKFDVLGWLSDYARRNPPKPELDKPQGYDRSDYFCFLTRALCTRLEGDYSQTVSYAGEIDRLSGDKYGNRATREAERALVGFIFTPNPRPVSNYPITNGIPDYINEYVPLPTELSSEARDSARLHPKQARAQEPTQPLFQGYTLDELDCFQTPEWLVREMIRKASQFAIIGESNAGKTFIGMHLCMIVVQNGGRAIYVAAEGDPADLRERGRAWVKYYKLDNYQNFKIIPETLELLNPASISAFIAAWKDFQPDLIILDTFGDCTAGIQENDAGAMGLAMAACKSIKLATGAALGVIHHLTKNGNTERGSSVFRQRMDTMIKAVPDDGFVRVSCEKQRSWKKFPDWRIQLTEFNDTLVVTEATPGATSVKITEAQRKLLEALNMSIAEEAGLKSEKLVVITGLAESTCWNALNQLKKKGYVKQHAKGNPFYITEAGQDIIQQGKL